MGGGADGAGARSVRSEACIASVFQRVMSAVAYMHSKELIHRDLKPANFLLAVEAASAEEFAAARVCCADFGLAQGVDEVGATALSMLHSLLLRFSFSSHDAAARATSRALGALGSSPA